MNIKNLLLILFMLSGLAALIYEITWIRPLQFLLGSTVYTLSIIFSVFMLGLAIGAGITSKYINKIKNLPRIYALLELGIGLYAVLLLSIFNILPGLYNSLYFLHQNFYVFELVQFILVFILLLIPTALMGATFPIVARFYTEEKNIGEKSTKEKEEKIGNGIDNGIGNGIGKVYSVNNIGAMIGSFIAGFILIPLLGIKLSIVLAGSINLLIGFVILFFTDKNLFKKLFPLVLIVFFVFAFFGDYNIQTMHSGGFYRTRSEVATLGNVVYYQEGLYATVSVRELFNRGKALLINGYGQGSTEIADLRVNFLLAYLPLLINPETEKALVIGLGTGTTSGQLAQFINVTTIEIEPAIIGASKYFSTSNMNVFENPNHKLIIDDGRNYLLKNKEKYDVIISEPTNTWQSFSTQLYSKEFLEIVKNRLNKKGLFIKWIPIYTMSVNDFKDVYKTFNSVFPYTVAFANIKSDENTPVKFGTSEIILVGSNEKINIDKDKMNLNYNSLSEQSKQYLQALRLSSGDEIYHLLLFNEQDIMGYAKNAELITDDKPILEFSTAKKVLNQNPEEIINDIQEFLGKIEKIGKNE